MPSIRIVLLLVLAFLAASPLPATAQEETVKDLVPKIRAATREGRIKEALELCDKAIKLDGANPQLYGMRGQVLDFLKKYNEAIADFDKAISIKAGNDLYQRRGETHFRAGNFKESVADFDKVVAGDLNREAHHWQRGISHYYAGMYKEGVNQFELHKEVNPQDVENAIWHFLCKAKVDGVDKARNALIAIRDDGRPWAMTVYSMFRGNAKPQDVLDNATKGETNEKVRNDNLFYSHLYIALYHDAVGARAEALDATESSAY